MDRIRDYPPTPGVNPAFAASLLAAVLATASPAHAFELSDLPNANPNPSGTTIEILTPDAENSAQPYINEGTIDIKADATAGIAGVLTNVGGAQLNNDGVLVIRSDDAAGTQPRIDGELQSSGRLQNTGTLDSSGLLHNQSGGVITNTATGSVENRAGARLQNDFGGNILNHGSVTNDGTIVTSGVFDNLAGATLTNRAGGVLRIEPVTGASRLFNRAGATIENFGTFSNFSAFQNSGYFVNRSGAVAGLGFGSFVNATGELLNEAGATVEIKPTGDFNMAGLLTNYGAIEVDPQNGTYVNVGTTLNFGTLTYGSLQQTSLNNRGVFRNKSGARLLGGSFWGGENSLLVNESGASFEQHGNFQLYSNVQNDSGGVIRIYDSDRFDVLGSFVNHGAATLDSLDQPTNLGARVNRGTISNLGALELSIVELLNAGTIENEGTLTHAAGSVLQNIAGPNESYPPGTIRNGTAGTLTNNGVIDNGIGGTFTNAGTLQISAMGSILGDGNYLQTAGSTVVNGSMTQNLIDIQGGSLSGSGTITGTVLVGSGSSVNPGNSPGTLHIDGDFSLDGGLVNIEVAGLSPGEFDVLEITGDADFGPGGSIILSFLGGFLPGQGTLIPFLSVGGTITGFEALTFQVRGTTTPFTGSIVVNGSPVTFTASPVPLPSAVWLLVSALGGIMVLRPASRVGQGAVLVSQSQKGAE